MLYTRKGDAGDTHMFGCNQRLSKNSEQAEALGALDEINSLLGVCKMKAGTASLRALGGSPSLADILRGVQQDLFIVQAAIAGAEKHITQEKVVWLETIIDAVEKIMPPITTFLVVGGTELAALLDCCRAVARRAERRVVAFSEKEAVAPEILMYMNRLSSLLYALARAVNSDAGIHEEPPTYR